MNPGDCDSILPPSFTLTRKGESLGFNIFKTKIL